MILGPYYIDFTRSIGEDFSEYEFNPQGIPLVRFNRSPEWQHNPVTICQYALNRYNNFIKTGDSQFKSQFLVQVDWLMKNFSIGPNDSIVWYYQLKSSFYNLNKPWISGMAQGEALSVSLRAHQLTGNKAYYEIAQKIYNIFSVPVDDGGVIANFPDGSKLIEEYPTRPPSCVLNGFILSLFGIYDYWRVTKENTSLELFNCCVNSIKKNLKNYDTNYWTLYDLWKPSRLTSRYYHSLHIILLTKLYDLTNESIFLTTSLKWKKYLKNPICNSRWALHKLKQRLKSE